MKIQAKVEKADAVHPLFLILLYSLPPSAYFA
jgi:hypothetical protein